MGNMVKKMQSRKRRHIVTTKTKMIEKQQDFFLCYICLERIAYPLRVCKRGHYACALCLANQFNVVRIVWNEKNLPMFQIEPNLVFRCGVCKERNKIKSPGSWLTTNINPEQENKCPCCTICFPLDTIAKHILTCGKTLLFCPICKELVKQEDFNNIHLHRECLKLPCFFCQEQMSWNQLVMHTQEHESLFQLRSQLLKAVGNPIFYFRENQENLQLILNLFNQLFRVEYNVRDVDNWEEFVEHALESVSES